MSRCIVVFGSPIDGLSFVGPFDSMAEAISFARSDSESAGPDLWIAELAAPPAEWTQADAEAEARAEGDIPE